MKNLGFSKAVLMLLVIVGHALAFWSGEWFPIVQVSIEEPALNLCFEWLSSFHIYAFVLISGYIFAYKVRKDEYNDFTQFLKKKVKRLLVPYLFVMFIWVAPLTEYLYKWDILTLFKKYILCINPSQLWYLWMLFWIFALIWPLKNKMIEKPVTGWIIAFLSYGIGLLGSWKIIDVFCIWEAFRFIPFFYIGMRIHKKESDDHQLFINKIPCLWWFAFDILLFSTTIYIKNLNGSIWAVIRYGSTFLLNLTGAVMAYKSLSVLGSRINAKNNRLIKKLASYSMPMYLFHQQIIYFSILALNGKVNPWAHAAINFTIAIIGSYLISFILMRWKITRILIGEKA